ncbi:specifically androgen-regulated gene protein isoform X2 [Eptesicus fuscus]|uniref:specifically androgen-regulated gene protein isoform X2 n=1 Tax=Eptesicus fuscus TaxID=29078 RepID=UPI002403F1B1|nr:specifically androgen-regulated gene protein isoform X2 [Eptesicus fuscus]
MGMPCWGICPSSQAQLGTFFASLRFPSGSPFRRPCTLLLAMPERELWPEGPGSEPVTRIGSWDSMTSTTSTRSGSTDSYDFLSAEEKECLLFLEETIGSLDTEADSGLSTEESEQATTPQSPRALPLLQPAPQEAFRDSQPEQGGEDSLPTGPGEKTPAPQLLTSLSPQKRKETSSEAMSQNANEKGSTGAPGQPRPLPAMSSQNARAADASVPPGRDPNAQVAPLTGPKPRKLPPNIVLKSSRSSFHSDPQHWLSRHSEAAPGDSGLVSSSLQEQRKARKEALEKLGLPQDQEKPSPHLSKPTSSIRLKGTGPQAPSPAPASSPALAQPAPQVSAAVPAAGKAFAPAPTRGPSPMKALAPALAQGSTPGKVFIPAQEPTPGKVPAAKSMPIPISRAPGVSSPLTLQESSIPGLRQMNFKSNTLERSGVGLSSYLSAEKDPSSKTSTSLGKDPFLSKISPNDLRNSRPRPASLGTGKDFAGIQVSKLADHEQSSKRLSYQGQSRDKLPRPSCVSVKISPKGIPDEHRREALKKLGLWKE